MEMSMQHGKIANTGRRLGLLLLTILFVIAGVQAQNPFEDAVKQLSSENAKGYLQPFVTGLGANLNSGTYTTADIGMAGFTFKLQFVGMATIIGDAEKKFNAVAPEPFAPGPYETATVFGDLGTLVTDDSSGLSYRFQNGQVKADYIPLVLPQITIGDFYGTQATLRYAPIPKMGDFPKVDLFGIGVRHNISQYFVEFPVSVSAGFFYQTLSVGDIMDINTFNFGAQVSKSFSVLTLYGGLQYEKANVELGYTYTGPGATPDSRVSVEFEGKNTFRGTAGFSLNLAVFHLNADINVGNVTLASAGIGFGF
jgi:hypothetical protein